MEGYCDKKRAACGVGRVIVSLDRQTLALIRIAAATATGDEAKLRDRMIAARAVDVPPQWVDELLLQSFLNVGYPLALVAFGVWRGIEGPRQETMEDERIAHPDWERWTTRGVEACGPVDLDGTAGPLERDVRAVVEAPRRWLVRRVRQRHELRGRFNRLRNAGGCGERLLAWKFAVADQHADMVDADARDRSGLVST